MSPSEFRAALAALGLPVVGAARVFGVNQRTAQRWASGEQEVPRAVEVSLALMLAFEVDPHDLPNLLDRLNRGLLS